MDSKCRHCGSPLEHQVIDLGHQPPSNAYLTSEQLTKPEITYPLQLMLCTHCWLMQLPAHAPAEELFTADYAYFSSTSSSWCTHAKNFVREAISRLGLNTESRVIEIASNDGYLLQYVQELGIPCQGIEPTDATAEVAIAKGIKTLKDFFNLKLAKEMEPADLVVANNVLAHVPEINDFLAGIKNILKPRGMASIECPHLLKLLQYNQFDTIYHEHYSYLSLKVVERMASVAGLIVADVEELRTHGGSLRFWLARESSGFKPKPAVKTMRIREQEAGLETIQAWNGFQARAEAAKNNLLRFLLMERVDARNVLGYGAAAKGNTFLNYAGIRRDLVAAVADRARSKQGKFLPGSHIPIISPSQLAEHNPETLLVLPWNIIEEVAEQWPKSRLITAIPDLKIWGQRIKFSS